MGADQTEEGEEDSSARLIQLSVFPSLGEGKPLLLFVYQPCLYVIATRHMAGFFYYITENTCTSLHTFSE